MFFACIGPWPTAHSSHSPVQVSSDSTDAATTGITSRAARTKVSVRFRISPAHIRVSCTLPGTLRCRSKSGTWLTFLVIIVVIYAFHHSGGRSGLLHATARTPRLPLKSTTPMESSLSVPARYGALFTSSRHALLSSCLLHATELCSQIRIHPRGEWRTSQTHRRASSLRTPRQRRYVEMRVLGTQPCTACTSH